MKTLVLKWYEILWFVLWFIIVTWHFILNRLDRYLISLGCNTCNLEILDTYAYLSGFSFKTIPNLMGYALWSIWRWCFFLPIGNPSCSRRWNTVLRISGTITRISTMRFCIQTLTGKSMPISSRHILVSETWKKVFEKKLIKI